MVSILTRATIQRAVRGQSLGTELSGTPARDLGELLVGEMVKGFRVELELLVEFDLLHWFSRFPADISRRRQRPGRHAPPRARARRGWLVMFDLRKDTPWVDKLFLREVVHGARTVRLVGC